MNYYNEHDPNAAAWLRVLIAENLIPKGEVDERDIQAVTANDLGGFIQCHFFAGIGGWSLALHLAGWPSGKPVWTMSCPCQPFSTAGQGAAQADPRHLWPVAFGLARQCRPDVVFGEQVESAIGFGWLDGISADLEGEGYALGAVVLGAHSVGSPHRRQRLYWVADSNGSLAQPRSGGRKDKGFQSGNGYEENSDRKTNQPGESSAWSDFQIIGCKDGKARRIPVEPILFGVADGISTELDYFGDIGLCKEGIQEIKNAMNGFPLAGKMPARAALLKGFGNAIVPEVAAEFIQAFMEVDK